MRIHKITRRNFMKVAGVSALAMGLAACGGSSSSTAASTSTAGSAAGADFRLGVQSVSRHHRLLSDF